MCLALQISPVFLFKQWLIDNIAAASSPVRAFLFEKNYDELTFCDCNVMNDMTATTTCPV